MTADSVTLRLGGDVTVAKLSEALDRFSDVLNALQKEAEANVEWVVSGLEHGSAVATARAVPLDDHSSQLVPGLYDGYLDAAHSVAGGSVDGSRPVLKLVRDLTAIADERNEVVLETAVDEVVFWQPAAHRVSDPVATTSKSLGTVRGRVETLSHRGTLRFSLYDLTTDRPVSCYLDPDHETVMRDAWGRIADVTGTIARDVSTGRPRSIRRITSVDVVDDGNPDSYILARGSIQLREPSEEVVRRMRDAG